MKSRFTSLDVRAVVAELQELAQLGLRVVNVYDVDNKTYLIRLAKPDMKRVLLFESGLRIHSTDFEWPKPTMPSQFSLKCRKHLKSRRLGSVRQLGDDRVVDLQFGSDEAAYHMIVELYDRGNVVLTDYQYTILSLLRRRTDNDDVRFAVHEVYPMDGAYTSEPVSKEKVLAIMQAAQPGDTLRKLFSPHFVFGPQLMDHCLRMFGLALASKVTAEANFLSGDAQESLYDAMCKAESIMRDIGREPRGFIIQKELKKPQASAVAAGTSSATPSADGASKVEEDVLVAYDEFHPVLFSQHEGQPHREFSTLNQACDEYFSKQEEQKIDVKQLHQEKQAVKKLNNVRKDLQQRVDTLQRGEEESEEKAGLIEMNVEVVKRALLILNSALANAVDWPDIAAMIREAKLQGDPTASSIAELHFERNSFTMSLRDPYEDLSDEGEDDDADQNEVQRAAAAKARAKARRKKMKKVEIDLSLSAHANAKHYYSSRRYNAQKKEKTIGSSAKALKSAQKKTRQTLKDSATITNIRKTRKFYWFEKFLFFISSENYMIIGGRDQQQNEIVVRRYLKPGDVYVHADIHGATSCVVKNPSGGPIPPKTLQEAGVFALCHSSAWNAKIVTSAWWVYHHQVSKTAPTGEYLTTGSFMIRGKKNFLPPSQLVMGFGFLFRVDESCLAQHMDERRCHPEALSAAAAAASSANDIETATVAEPTPDATDISSQFPDTSVDLRHTGQANKFEYQISVSSTASESVGGAAMADLAGTGNDEDDGTVIYLGDDQPVHIRSMFPETDRSLLKSQPGPNRRKGDPPPGKRGASAKAAPNGQQAGEESASPAPSAASSTAGQPKRGKKGKQRKAQDRYADQDDEDKAARMRLLQSAGPSDSKKEKGKKGRGRKPRKGGGKGGDDDDHNDDTPSRSARGQQAPSLAELLGHHKKAQESQLNKVQAAHGGELEADLSDNEDNISDRSPPPNHAGCDGSDDEQQLGSDNEDTSQNASSDVDDAATGMHQLDVGSTSLQDGGSGQSGGSDAEPGQDDDEEPGQGDDEEPGQGDDEEQQAEGGEVAEAAEASEEEQGEDDSALPTGEQNALFYSSFTGCPKEDDLLLFALPVVAPYGAMLDYKFKVKMTPGLVKRGRAAKSGLEMFLRSSDTRPREKDLLRVVKDNDMSRAFPGPASLAGPQLQTRKGKSGKF